ncbi:MAG: MerR family transcriptional regulator [Desulfurivibrio sp.]|nr:MerR family transcriptional regulator [Desulfurivibrio sp.]
MSQDRPIPDKLYFKIGEVCEITGIKQHVLRYWETEFKILSPQRANSRQRLYRRVDVENILRIKKLLKEEGFTISGAKKHLARSRRREQTAGSTGDAAPDSRAAAAGLVENTVDEPPPNVRVASIFGGLKRELQDLQKILAP